VLECIAGTSLANERAILRHTTGKIDGMIEPVCGRYSGIALFSQSYSVHLSSNNIQSEMEVYDATAR
jgi:hypothetical protein